MSAYHSYQTKMNDAATLVRALHLESGGKWLPVTHGQPVQLEGYTGDRRKERAEIVVPRKQVGGASNDVGFQRDENGNFQAIVSEFDRSRGLNDAWLKRIQRRYTEEKIVTDLRARGYTTFEREEVKGENGETRLVLRAQSPRGSATVNNPVRRVNHS